MRPRYIYAVGILLLLAIAFPAVPTFAQGQPQEPPADGDCQEFAETGHSMCGVFLDFWQTSGGLPVFGYPLTDELSEPNPDTGETYTVQYLERERFEHHPELAGTPYEVLLGRLGAQVLSLTGRDWQTFPKMDANAPHYFAESGFAIAPEFWEYWSSHGLEYGDQGVTFRESLLLFGYPISQPAMETNPDGDTVLTQWFERARFEFHPDNPAESQILLGRLGAEILDLLEEPPPPTGQLSAGLDLVADNLTAPLMLAEAPDDSGRLFIVDQVGVIWIVTPDGTLRDQPFLDLRDQIVELNPGYDERGLLGLAFHPNYAENGRFFVYYSIPLREDAPDEWNHANVLAEFQVSADDPKLADPASERRLLVIDWPYMNHNGGTVAFGPDDGYLYLSMGDGGNRDDQGMGHVEDWYERNAGGNGQDIEQNLLGNILRIDVDAEGDQPYGIPADNPFVEGPGLDEIYAYGFRNPYRFSFDMGGDHALFAGDAGQNLYEEVDMVVNGGNYGWNVMEGTHCFDTDTPETPPEDCPQTVGEGHPDAGAPLLPPIIEFRNASYFDDGLGVAVVGGHVYRGDTVSALAGRYVFATWSNGEADEQNLPGELFVGIPNDGGLWEIQQVSIAGTENGNLGHLVLGFGQDTSGEVYVMTTDESGPSGNTGKVYKLVSPE